MEKFIDKVDELLKNLEGISKLPHLEGEDKLQTIMDVINRIIDRVYPEKDATELKKKMIVRHIAFGELTDEEKQNDYVLGINRAIRVINIIKEEFELFGFDDLKPIKEKVETEWQVGSDKLGYFKKKKTR